MKDEQCPLVDTSNNYGTESVKEDELSHAELPESNGDIPRKKTVLEIAATLSTAFAYGCVLTTLFLITLPVECQRIHQAHPSVPKSVILGIFVAIAGTVQLVSPLVGMLSDTYRPPTADLGQRLPYLVLGAMITVIGLFGSMFSSDRALWLRYGFAFFLHMIGLMIIYTCMIALIPDQIPESQTGIANGIMALLLVLGSLFGFGLFHSVFSEKVLDMYGLYICIVILTTIVSCIYAHPGDVEHAQKIKRESSNQSSPPPTTPVLTPTLLFRTMLYDPFANMDWNTLKNSYTIDMGKYHDFFVVTVSRTFYYMGISVQTFFLYYLHDVIRVRENPENAVATLAILGQCSGAITCYPVGWLSDALCCGRRKPFVYLACLILFLATLSLSICTTLSQVTIVALILGGANGMYLTMDTSLAVDTLPNEHDEGSGHAQLLGIWGVAGFIGSALGPLVGGPLLYLFGNATPHDDTVYNMEEYSRRGYAVIFSLSAAYFAVSGAVLCLFIKNPNV